MKTLYVKKGKGIKPVVGASILEKKPSVGEYINFNVPRDIKYKIIYLGGQLAEPPAPLQMNSLINADSMYINIASTYGPTTGGVNFQFSVGLPPLFQDRTVGELLNALNTRMGGMGHVVLENGVFYLTKSGLPNDVNYVGLSANNWC